MANASDMERLRDYDRDGSEEAFTELVQRHVNLVYSVALRHVGRAAPAEEITQAVFITLARKAGGMRPGTILEGWLHETTRLTSLSFLRGERRRQLREQEAYMQSTLEDSPADSSWNQLAPLLDEGLSRLGKKDRDAVMLRFFNEKTVREVARAMQVNEGAAQRRILRALEKLRLFFARRGVVSTTAIIAGAISANAVQAAPATLAKSASAAAVAKGAAAGTSTLSLVKGALKVMAWTKAKTATVVCVGVLLAAGTTTVTVKEVVEHRSYPWEVPLSSAQVLNNAAPQVRIVPAKFPPGGMLVVNGKMMGIGQPLSSIFPHAFRINWARTVCHVQLPAGNFDFIASLPEGSAEALQREIERKFGLVAKRETRETDVLLLTDRIAGVPDLRPSSLGPRITGSSGSNAGHFWCKSNPLSTLAAFLESCFQVPVIDRTGLTGKFDIDLKWHEQDWRHHNLQGLKQALLEQLGLELVPARAPVEMLVVDKAK